MNPVDWALTQDLPPAKKLLLITLVWVADDSGVTFKSQDKIAGRAGEEARWVRHHLPALAAEGLVTRYRRHRQNGSRTTDLLIINFPRTEQVDLSIYSGIVGEIEAGDREPTGGNTPGGLPAEICRPTGGNPPPRSKPLEETSSEETKGESSVQQQLVQVDQPEEDVRPSSVLSEEKARRAADVQEVFSHWVKVTQPKRETLTASRERTISRALNEADVALVKQAIDGMVAWTAQRGGDLTLSRCLQSRPGGSPLLETIEWWASQAASARVDEQSGFHPAMPTGLDNVFAASMRARLDSLRSYHTSPNSLQAKNLAHSAVAWLEQRGFKVGRNPDGSPYIYDKTEVPT